MRRPYRMLFPCRTLKSSPEASRWQITHSCQVAHGLILRAFAKRWMQYALDFPLPMMMAPGAIAVLRCGSFLSNLLPCLLLTPHSYKNGNIDEPGFYLGMSLPFEE